MSIVVLKKKTQSTRRVSQPDGFALNGRVHNHGYIGRVSRSSSCCATTPNVNIKSTMTTHGLHSGWRGGNTCSSATMNRFLWKKQNMDASEFSGGVVPNNLDHMQHICNNWVKDMGNTAHQGKYIEKLKTLHADCSTNASEGGVGICNASTCGKRVGGKYTPPMPFTKDVIVGKNYNDYYNYRIKTKKGLLEPFGFQKPWPYRMVLSKYACGSGGCVGQPSRLNNILATYYADGYNGNTNPSCTS